MSTGVALHTSTGACLLLMMLLLLSELKAIVDDNILLVSASHTECVVMERVWSLTDSNPLAAIMCFHLRANDA